MSWSSEAASSAFSSRSVIPTSSPSRLRVNLHAAYVLVSRLVLGVDGHREGFERRAMHFVHLLKVAALVIELRVIGLERVINDERDRQRQHHHQQRGLYRVPGKRVARYARRGAPARYVVGIQGKVSRHNRKKLPVPSTFDKSAINPMLTT